MGHGITVGNLRIGLGIFTEKSGEIQVSRTTSVGFLPSRMATNVQ
jgi:hypothetical protein